MLIRSTAAGVALAASATLAAAAPSGHAAPAERETPASGDFPTPRLSWTNCERGEPAAKGSECAILNVPVDWDRPHGPTFDLALARRAAKSPQDRVGSMVFGPGGPGDSGVDRIRTGMSRFSAELQRRFDIVSFDPRGVGDSNPVTCSPGLLAKRPAPLIRNQVEFRHAQAFNRTFRKDCRARTGPVYDHLDSMSTVRDLDAIRAALGEPKLTFHGSSYGTLLGEEYAETHPRRIRASVLEGVDDHSLGLRRFLDTQASTAQDSFDEFAKWCDRTTSCPLHGRDIDALWASLLDRAERGDLADPKDATHALSPFVLSFLTMRTFYDPDWPGLAELLQQVDQAPPPTTTEPTPLPIPTAMAVFCQDWNLQVHSYREYARHLRRLARIAPQMRYPGALMAVSYCLGAPPAANPQHRLHVRRASTPLLMTNSLHDPATGYNWASAVARQLGRDGRLLTYQGWGHGTYNNSPCAQLAVDRYLISQTLPRRGARCPAVNPVP